MAFVVLVPLLAALGAALVAWQYSTRLDRSQHEGWSQVTDDRGRWTFALGALIAAVLAVTVLQTILLSGLQRHLSG